MDTAIDTFFGSKHSIEAIEANWGVAPLFLPASEFERKNRARLFPPDVRSFGEQLMRESHNDELSARCCILQRPDKFLTDEDGGMSPTDVRSLAFSFINPPLRHLFHVSGYEKISSVAEEIVDGIREQFGLIGKVGASIIAAPPGPAMGLHFDATSVFQVLCWGKKKWRVSKRSLAPWVHHETLWQFSLDPDRGQFHSVFGDHINLDEVGFLEFEQNAGDLLYLPPGTPHEIYYEEESLGISFAHRHLGWFEALKHWFAHALMEVPELRGPLPHPGRPITRADTAPIYEALRHYIDASEASNGLAREVLLRASEESAPRRPTPAPMTPESLIELVPGVRLFFSEPGEDGTQFVYALGQEIELESEAQQRWFRALSQRPRFTLEDAKHWPESTELEWPLVLHMLRSLLEQGILRKAG